MDFDEFKKAIRDFQIDVQDSDIRRLFNYFDKSKDGQLNYDEFLLGKKKKKIISIRFIKFIKKVSEAQLTIEEKNLFCRLLISLTEMDLAKLTSMILRTFTMRNIILMSRQEKKLKTRF